MSEAQVLQVLHRSATHHSSLVIRRTQAQLFPCTDRQSDQSDIGLIREVCTSSVPSPRLGG